MYFRDDLFFYCSVHGSASCEQGLILSENFGSERLLLGGLHRWGVIAGFLWWHKRIVCMYHVVLQSHDEREVFFWPRLIFNTMDATFTLMSQCRSIRAYIVGYPPVLGSIGFRKSMRTPSTLHVILAMLSYIIGGINGGLILWNNSYNLLNRYLE